MNKRRRYKAKARREARRFVPITSVETVFLTDYASPAVMESLTAVMTLETKLAPSGEAYAVVEDMRP